MQALGFALYPWLYGYILWRLFHGRHSGSGSARQPTRRGARSTDMCFSFSLESFPHIRPCGPYSHTIGHISRQPNL